MEKPQLTTGVSSMSHPASTHQTDDASPALSTHNLAALNWRPGYIRRIPWKGFFGLTIVLICALVNVGILIASNGVSSSKWPERVAPHIIIGTLLSVSGLGLAMAIGGGVSIAWWRKATRGATVKDLHQSWENTNSTRKLLMHFRRWDILAMAALAAKVTILDSFLYQNAASTYVAHDPAKDVTLLGLASQTFPETAYVVGPGSYMISDQYTPTVNTFETSNGFFTGVVHNFEGCDGICYSWVDAAGFEINCDKTSTHGDFAGPAIAAYTAQNGSGNSSAWTNLPIFNSSFMLSSGDADANYTHIDLILEYFDSNNVNQANALSCPGTVTSVQCALRPALIRYPTTIVNYSNPHVVNGISIGGRPHDNDNTMAPPTPTYNDSNRQAEGFQVLSYLDVGPQDRVNSTTQLGGIMAALSQFMSSTASITYLGNDTWMLNQVGTFAQTMMFGPPNPGTCDCSFHDALSSLVEGINQLSFLTATNTAITVANATAGVQTTVIGINENTTATYTSLGNSLEVRDVTFYKTEWNYMYGGIGSTILMFIMIVPAFWRYGQLGRKVTLGPMEVANAFNAPMLEAGHQQEHPKDLDDLMTKVGQRKVQYGVVEEIHSPDQIHSPAFTQQSFPASPVVRPVSANTPQSPLGSPNTNQRNSVRLGMAEPGLVRPVSGMWSPPTSPKIASPPTSPRS